MFAQLLALRKELLRSSFPPEFVGVGFGRGAERRQAGDMSAREGLLLTVWVDGWMQEEESEGGVRVYVEDEDEMEVREAILRSNNCNVRPCQLDY